MSIPTRVIETFQYVPAPGWTEGAHTVLRAGRLAAGPDYRISRDRHQGQDLVFCIDGTGTAESLGRRHAVSAGQMVWLANEAPHGHAANPVAPWTVAWCRIDGPGMPALRRKLFGDGVPLIAFEDQAPLLAWFERLFSTMRSRDAAIDFRLNLLVAELLWLLGRDDAGDGAGRLPPVLARLVEEMRKSPERSWSAQDISDVTGLGGSQNRRLFRRHLGTSPKGWLMRERLMLSQKYLVETDEPVAAIAERCGFCDVYHFSRAFKQMVGTGPARWRRNEVG